MQAIDEPAEGRDGYGGEGGAASTHRLDRNVCGPAACVVLSGEIDCGCAGVVEEALMAAVEERGVRFVVVDLSGLSFMDAKCAGVLIRVRCQADQRGVAMTVTHVSGIPRRVLEILGCYDRLQTCPTDGDYSPPFPPKAP